MYAIRSYYELKGAADDACDQLFYIGTGMGKDIVLTAGFTHDSGIGNVGFNVFCRFFPKILEHRRGSGEVHTGKVLMGEQDIGSYNFV